MWQVGAEQLAQLRFFSTMSRFSHPFIIEVAV